MKIIRLLLNMLLLLFIVIILPFNGYGALSDGFTPSQPPRLPITDYQDESVSKIDLGYLNYSNDDIDFTGLGFGYNYISPFGDKDLYVFNLGLGINYLTGESNSTSADGFSIPLNANIGYKLSGNHDDPGAIMFGGLHYSYTYVYVDSYSGIEVNVSQWGPIFGFKGEFPIDRNVKFIPFYALRLDFSYINVYVGDNYYYTEDSSVSHLIGFDIEFAEVSIGAVFDMINNTDGKLIVINGSIKF